jgi:hypothetical protein
MTRDDIIRLAREAGFDVDVQDMFNYKPQHSFTGSDENIERFAALVAEVEREACAKVCEDGPLPKDPTPFIHIPTIVRCATAIRARGQ